MTSGVHGARRAMSQPEPGEREWLGPYRLIERLGEGGMGVVYLARNPRGAAVAIKVLRPHIAHDVQARRRLAREVDTLSRVRSPRVAAVLDADVDGDRPYLVTQYAPGPSLEEVVAQEGPLRDGRLLRVARGLFDALQAIHGVGVVHRDLKPANVLLVDGDPVVIDFGIAHVADDIRLTSTGLVMGTPGYLSPEVVSGAPVTDATDWWGWAATLAYAASGAPPFGRGPMSVVLDRVQRGQADLSGVDPRFAPVLRSALAPAPGYRPTAHEVIGALERYACGGSATVAVPLAVPPAAGPTQSYDQDIAQAISTAAAAGPDPTQRFARPDRTSVMPAVVPPSAAFIDRPPPGGYQPEPQVQPVEQAAWPYGDNRDPRIGRATRSATLLAGFAALVAVSVVYPYLALALVVLWSLAARFADRCVTSMVLRRHSRGVRRSDVPVAVAAGPWHLVSAALATLLALLLPALVALACLVAGALVVGIGTNHTPAVERSLPVGFALTVAVLLMWWGPGGASLRRGSRSLVRGTLPGGSIGTVVTGLLWLAAAAFTVWAWTRHGMLDLHPFPAQRVPTSWLQSR